MNGGPRPWTAGRPGEELDVNLFLGVALLLGVLLPFAVGGFALGLRDVPLKLLTFIGAELAGLRLGWLIASRRLRLGMSIVWLFVYLSFGLAPLAQIRSGVFPLTYSPPYLYVSLLLVGVGLISLEIGASIRRRNRSARPRRGTPARRIGVQQRLSLGRVRFLTWFSYFGSAWYISSIGNVQTFFQSRSDVLTGLSTAGDQSQAGNALVTNVAQVPALLALMAWLSLLTRVPQLRSRASAVAHIGLLAALNIVINNPISNSRYWSVAVLMGLIFCCGRLTLRKVRIVLVGAVLGAIFVFPYADYFRVDASARAPLTAGSIQDALTKKDFDQWSMLSNGMHWVHVHGFQFGRQISGPLLFWVPRQMWMAKPMDTGVLVGREVPGAGTTNLSSPLWLEFYIDFGVVGVVLGFVIVGRVVAHLDRSLQMAVLGRAKNEFDVAVLPLLLGYGLIILRGPLLQATARLVVVVVVAGFLVRRTDAAGPHDLGPVTAAGHGECELSPRDPPGRCGAHGADCPT